MVRVRRIVAVKSFLGFGTAREPRPNHSVKRTAPGAPASAACLKRYATKTLAGAFVLIGLLTHCGVSGQQLTPSDIAAAERIVEALRDLPTPLPIVGNGAHPAGQPVPIPRSEIVRDASYRGLHRLGPAGITALARAYGDADVRLRRNVALAFLVLAGGIWPDLDKMDVGSVLPELTRALADEDSDVRTWSAQAIGMIGPKAESAVPELIRLLRAEDEASRNGACSGLRGIGPPAVQALPALRRALSDPSAAVRRFAGRAIEAIEG